MKERLDNRYRYSLANTFVRLTFLLFLLPWCSARAQTIQGPPEVAPEFHHDVSRPLRDILPLSDRRPGHQMPLHRFPPAGPLANVSDPVIQSSAGAAVGTTPGLGFGGVGNGFVGPQGSFVVNSAPPDTNGAVG